MRTGWIRAVGGMTALAAITALGLGACGDDTDEARANTDEAQAGTGEETRTAAEGGADAEADAQALVFAECMRTNGIEMPDPAPGQNGFFDAFHSVADRYDQGDMQQAMGACQDYFPTYGGMGAAHGGDDEATLALADCLRDQGIDVPDNLFDDGALLDVDRDELGEAMQACNDELSGGGG